MKKISKSKEFHEDVKFPHIYYKYLWLLGQFIQHSLLYVQGIRVPEPPELKEVYPDKNPAELIDMQRELYGCKFDWDTGSVIVNYKDEQFDVSEAAKEIVAVTANRDKIACCGFDDRGFDFNRACNIAVKAIIESIIAGQVKPL